jgi:cytochrome P450
LKKKNPMRSIFAQDSSFLPSFVKEQIERRVSDRASEVHSSNVAHSRDFLDKFLDAKYAHPEIVDDTMIWSYSMTNVGAGSDSVAIPLRTILYYVLRNLDVKDRLMDELRSSSLKLPPSFQKAKALTYLDAVIRESLRFHPPVGLGLERVTPKGGLSLECGILIAPGTQVSICPWVVNRDRHIFGSDADEFNPQRWLQSPGEALEDFRSRKRRMDKYDFTFGHGPRMCIGKNISLLEIYKLIPTLFLAFDMDIVSNEWKVQNSWFVRQEGLRVILKDL